MQVASNRYAMATVAQLRSIVFAKAASKRERIFAQQTDVSGCCSALGQVLPSSLTGFQRLM